jgi:hypothetical protein
LGLQIYNIQTSEKQPSRPQLTDGSAGGHEENDEKYGQQEKYSNHQPCPLLKFLNPHFAGKCSRKE